MTVQTISVTRALVELKRLDERINKAITGGMFIARTVGRDGNKKVVGTADSLTAVEQRIQGSFDKVTGLIANREKIKSALVMSNASTRVTVMGRELSVAEAIELKSTVVFRTAYLTTMRHQLLQERAQVERANAALDVEIETSLNALYGADRTKIDVETVKTVGDVKRSQKEAALLDTGKIETRIEGVEADILNLSSELDFVLSESNAKTVISVDLS
jgi:hypothetical protein